MMSMKGDGKPVSFIEDCCVPLEHLADYTARLTEVFAKHGTQGTWYAHASVGTLHVRPILDMRRDGAIKMRAIAEEAAQLVKEYKGTYSGEHGDGLVRSEWIEPFFGPRLTAALGEVKALFDPKNLMNPGKIVSPTKQDDRTLFRFAPGYATQEIETGLDWSKELGLSSAVEMCNNNGHCRKFDAGTMCPSYRTTGDEQHLARARQHLAIGVVESARPGRHCFGRSARGAGTLCRLQGLQARIPHRRGHGEDEDRGHLPIQESEWVHAQDKLIAYLPRYARFAPLFAWATLLRNIVPGLTALSETLTGISANANCPNGGVVCCPRSARSNGKPRCEGPAPKKSEAYFGPERDVVLFTDTFSNYFEVPSNLFPGTSIEAAAVVLQRRLQRGFDRRGNGRAAALLRTHVSRGWHDRRSTRGGETHSGGVVAVCESRRSHHRIGAFLHYHVA